MALAAPVRFKRGGGLELDRRHSSNYGPLALDTRHDRGRGRRAAAAPPLRRGPPARARGRRLGQHAVRLPRHAALRRRGARHGRAGARALKAR
eukprot:CAMPEP_0119294978 /NCGR_PEP_ID=MMETSP1329-20130426/49003_1 /TAXON_ID=114041 /ORGANISM="Genus nov. species nov., Strain RCC1024" /LENGTH=92 /DNA_ID=CAMNT_0007295887 /DNA_START=56 /DNA_END=329 /DNA_ORIENTATION=-